MPAPADPGYGDPNAPVGSPEWAKRWRLEFQNVVKRLPEAPKVNLKFYDIGKQHRAWTLLADSEGEPFPDFDSFCVCPQPHGLGTDPAKFKAYLEAEIGKQAADLVTVSPAGVRGEEIPSDERKANSQGHDRNAKLRAILRAPELVQQMYRSGLITQQDAARMGPKAPTPEQAALVAEARQLLEKIDRTGKARDVRARAKAAVATALGSRLPTPLQLLQKAWKKASKSERESFVESLRHLGWITGKESP
jgi:hypothetical protein